MGIIFGKLFKSVEEDVVPEDVVPEDVVPEDVVPEDVVPEDVVSVAGKRKARDDGENLQGLQVKHRRLEERRRLDSSSCSNELRSTSGDTESRSSKRKALADDGPVEVKKRTLDPYAMFTSKYQQQEKLGQGGFGSVCAGFREADHLPVAIKHIPKTKDLLMHEDSDGKQIPMEVAIMLKLTAESEQHSAPIKLLDWYDLDQELILVLERPMPAVDLGQYILAKGGCMQEEEAKIIMRQLVDAAIDLEQKQIFHRDIKVENLLIETSSDGIRVRVIDFGVSCFDEEGAFYDCFYGTHIPPEWFLWNAYRAGPSSVFQIGVVLYDMVHINSFRWGEFYKNKQTINGRLSKNCKDFLEGCFSSNPNQRLTLEQLRDHLWMK